MLFFVVLLGLSAGLGLLWLALKGKRRIVGLCLGASLGLTAIAGHLIAGAALGGILYGLAFLLGGCWVARCLLPNQRAVVRGWLGLALGLALMMWLPALAAFFVRFSLAAQGIGLGLLVVLCVLAWAGRSGKAPLPWGEEDKKLLRLLLCVALPLTVIGCYLQWTHTILPVADGSLHVGQSTYGDLPLHLAIASSLRDASFPPDYNILPGALLTYPFLADSLSTSLMLLGYDLRAAVVFPGMLMTALVFSGYVLLAARMADTKKGAALAALFFFLNGGLGFWYLLDMQGRALGVSGSNELQSVTGLWNRIQLVLNGWYQTPANHAEFTTYNLRWSNVIVDMMVPQRTTLAGWCQVIPCLYLLYDALRPDTAWGVEFLPGADGPTARWHRRDVNARQAALLGIWAGMLPMVNTHCFLALGLVSLGWMVYDLIRNRSQMLPALLFWGLYGLLAVAVGAPQLFTWTFHQAVGNESFLQFQFNWVNGAQGMLDGYLWFYIKNIGLPFLLIFIALLEKNEKRRFVAAGAFVVYVLAEFIQFQPNPYDNNKLFYIWYMLCAVIAADYGLELLGRLKGLRARPVIAVLAAVCCFFTGTLAVTREMQSDYQMFSRGEVTAAAQVEETTARDAMFLTGDQHINFVSSLAGRNIVCGPDTWLYYHGFQSVLRQRHADVRRFYENPAANADVLETYGVDYILVSGHERYSYAVDEGMLRQMYPAVYDQEGITIYAAQAQAEAGD